MKNSRAGDTLKDKCQKCGHFIPDCRCLSHESSALWPRSGDRARSGEEMSARFSELKEAGSGTVFLNTSSEPNPGQSISIDLAPEAVIGGGYKIIRLIGRGGMGEVYLAKHLTLGKRCALKVIPPDQVNEQSWQRFQLEAKAVAKLEHINLVRVTDLGIHEACLPYYAMEYLEGNNLAEMLAEHGPTPLIKALEIFLQVCDGVACAHRGGIFHRDLKPANIMLTRTSSGRMEVKILDFGLAKLTKQDRFEQSLTSEGEVFGSPHYMSPEQSKGIEIDGRADIYSLGCTLFKTLTGSPPFCGEGAFQTILMHHNAPIPTLASFAPAYAFPQELELMVQKMLAKRPEDRYQAIDQICQELYQLQQKINPTKPVMPLLELCTVCGASIIECICAKLVPATAWPISEGSPRSEAEMTARFSLLKEEGRGTTFLNTSSTAGPLVTSSIGLAPNAIIGGAYKIIRLLGRGGMGEVYVAQHLTLNKRCALKVIPPDQVTDVAWQRFQFEARTIANLEHVNLVRVTDLGIHEGCLPFYAMDYLEGKTLSQNLAAHGPMPLKLALDTFVQVCDGVECAHKSDIMHRDLKPDNIMLLQTASGKVEVKILDFGLAKLTRHNRSKQSLTAVGDVFGSPNYMSPEQCGGEELDNRSDIYSIGCVLFEALTGTPPFAGAEGAAVFLGHLTKEAPSLESVVGPGKFPAAMEGVLARLLRKDPDERYQTVAELKSDLLLISGGKSFAPAVNSKVAAREEHSRRYRAQQYDKLPGRRKRSKTPLWIGLGLAVSVVAGGYIFHQVLASKVAKAHAAQNQMPAPGTIAPIPVPAAVTSSGPAQAGATALTTNSQTTNSPTTNSSSTNLSSTGLSGTSSSSTGPATGSGATAVDDDADKWDGTPFYKGIVQHEGKSFQHWSYVSDHPPLIFLGSEGPRGQRWVGLVGDIYLPAAAKISLMFRKEPVYPRQRLAALAGGNFDEINFGRYPLKEIELMAPTLAKCKSVTSIRLGDSDWSVDDTLSSIAVINQFPGLERLSISATCQGSTLAQISRLKQLKELRLNRSQPYLRDCLKLLNGSRELTSLGASSWGLPSDDLVLLTEYPSLQKVTIGHLTGSHEQFATLAGLPHLQELDMPALRYRPDLAADMGRLKSLSALKFMFNSDWTKEQITELRRDLPKIQVTASAMFGGSRRHSLTRTSGGVGHANAVGQSASTTTDQPAPAGAEQASPKSVDQPASD